MLCSIDIPQTARMADLFPEAGGTYFDTAYVYDNGESEAVFKAAVADRYPRERYTIAAKVKRSSTASMSWGRRFLHSAIISSGTP